MLKHSLMLAGILGASTGFSKPIEFKLESEIKTPLPAFLSLDQDRDDGPYRLIVTSFSAFGTDQVKVAQDIGANFKNPSALSFDVWTSDVPWPNEVHRVPPEIFGEGYYAVAGGFLVPGKGNGQIRIINPETDESFVISNRKNGYWYHKVHWVDMDGDGRLDILTARANKSLIGGGRGEMLWLKQPANLDQGPWTEEVIMKGPDVNFLYEDFDGDGAFEIIATEFWKEKLSLVWKDNNGQWVRKVIDEKLGAGFDLQWVDLDLDGKKDLLVTNHENGPTASVYAYEVPKNLRADNWTRHTLLTNIKTQVRGFGQASPGQARTFYPTSDESGRPHIYVAGDGSQKVHILNPVSQDAGNWEYEEQILVEVNKGVIGQITAGDVDGDGMTELFIPAYDEGRILLYSAQ